MKYIKSFERLSLTRNGVYWRIDLKSRLHLILALEKLGLTKNDNIYNDILSDYNDFNKLSALNMTHFYIMRGISVMEEVYWYYSVDISQFKNRFTYMGKVKITDFDVKKNQYNL